MSNSKEVQSRIYHVADPHILNPLPEKEKKLFERYKSLTIYDKDNHQYGNLDYYWDSEKNHWEIEYIHILAGKGFRKKGLGKILLKGFCQEIGSNQPIHAVIVHKDTFSMLREKYSNMLLPGESLFIAGENLKDVPFAKFLESGGIRVDGMSFAKGRQVGKHYSHSVRLWGTTK
jgi:hypothetical protein